MFFDEFFQKSFPAFFEDGVIAAQLFSFILFAERSVMVVGDIEIVDEDIFPSVGIGSECKINLFMVTATVNFIQAALLFDDLPADAVTEALGGWDLRVGTFMFGADLFIHPVERNEPRFFEPVGAGTAAQRGGNADRPVRFKTFGDVFAKISRDQRVGIQQHHDFAGGCGDTAVAAAGETFVFLIADQLVMRVLLDEIIQHFRGIRFGTVVDQNDFAGLEVKIFIQTLQETFDVLLGIVYRDHYGDFQHLIHHRLIFNILQFCNICQKMEFFKLNPLVFVENSADICDIL